jgi:hypothetical protein
LCIEVESQWVFNLDLIPLAKGHPVHQFIAIGDDDGTVHVLEVPKSFFRTSKNEVRVSSVLPSMSFCLTANLQIQLTEGIYSRIA